MARDGGAAVLVSNINTIVFTLAEHTHITHSQVTVDHRGGGLVYSPPGTQAGEQETGREKVVERKGDLKMEREKLNQTNLSNQLPLDCCTHTAQFPFIKTPSSGSHMPGRERKMRIRSPDPQRL
ncbi:hypothetical protein RRG08_030159 [Elysia crispata]|uniref:Uncharacterized protein n=1 Tax=Elysia crispata TaxID=231223 RepID=A0AAE1DKR2_9GAST|nr:hypothetical protein RRG08_030159 [Elysia crispata]